MVIRSSTVRYMFPCCLIRSYMMRYLYSYCLIRSSTVRYMYPCCLIAPIWCEIRLSLSLHFWYSKSRLGDTLYLCLGTISFTDTYEWKIELTLIATWNHKGQTISLDLGQTLTKNKIKSDKNFCTRFDGFILFRCPCSLLKQKSNFQPKKWIE